jgi:hypothetical protein
LIVNETDIIENILTLENQRRQINVYKVTQKSAINVLSNFPENGYSMGEWHDRMKFLLPLILLTLTLLIFTLIGLGKYLDKESQQ